MTLSNTGPGDYEACESHGPTSRSSYLIWGVMAIEIARRKIRTMFRYVFSYVVQFVGTVELRASPAVDKAHFYIVPSAAPLRYLHWCLAAM